MGDHDVQLAGDGERLRRFTRAILRDIEALDALLQRGGVETGVRRVGLEQEMFLVDERGRPCPAGPQVLAAAQEPRLTSELAVFNLEANLPPRFLSKAVLSNLEQELNGVVNLVNTHAKPHGGEVLLTGILPTLQQQDLSLESITPEPRYRLLNDAVMQARGGPYSVYIRGLDQLSVVQDSVMFESANTSFQVHLQVNPEQFVECYNLAQLISAPLLAAAANSPLLMGQRLWHETRVAVFERSVDARSEAQQYRGGRTRVSFGENWLTDSVLEVFREDAARFRVLLTRDHEEDPLAQVKAGSAPLLRALSLHNGTVWRWNRACYGSDGELAHLRIENRVLPSGPTVADEVANAALFWGLMTGLADQAQELVSALPFEAARNNFLGAARLGLNATLEWPGKGTVSAAQVLLQDLLPAARSGLTSCGVDAADVERFMGLLQQRIERRQTGAQWLLDSFTSLQRETPREVCSASVTVEMLGRQRTGMPVGQWDSVSGERHWSEDPKVADIMSTDLFTVRPQDVVDLAASVMDWRKIRHVPVESDSGTLVGLISHRALLRALTQTADSPPSVESLMDRKPLFTRPDARLSEAVRLMLDHDQSCVLVVQDGKLVGLITERDALRAMHRP